MPRDVRGQLASVTPHASSAFSCQQPQCTQGTHSTSMSSPAGLPWPRLRAGSCSQPHAVVTSTGACLQELVSDPAHFIPNLLRNLNDCVSPDTLPCAGTPALVGAVGYSYVSSTWRCVSLPSPMFLLWHLPLGSLPLRIFSLSSLLLICHPPALSAPSDYLVHGDSDQLGHRGD